MGGHTLVKAIVTASDVSSDPQIGRQYRALMVDRQANRW